MVISDVFLRGDSWNHVIDAYRDFFAEAPQYEIYMLAISVGIMYDKRIEKLEGELEPHSIGRNVFNTRLGDGKLEFMFQAAIISTSTVDFDEDTRLRLAFDDKNTDFNKLAFLTEFANYGVTILEEQIGTTKIETMENLKNFLNSSIEGRNFDIDALSDDEILDGFEPDFN
jgi:hypothetical protein